MRSGEIMQNPWLSGTRRLQILVAVFLGIVVAASIVLTPGPAPLEARCYGRYKASCEAYVKRCVGNCGKVKGIIAGCAKKRLLSNKTQCRHVFQQLKSDCVGDKSCVNQAKASMRSCVGTSKASFTRDLKQISSKNYGSRPCARCCTRSDGQGECSSYFQSSRWYGSTRSYGHLQCTSSDDGSEDGGGTGKPPCNPKKSRSGCPPGSPSGAFLAQGFSGSVRSRLAALVPWLTSSW
jgi:hypothetical protein